MSGFVGPPVSVSAAQLSCFPSMKVGLHKQVKDHTWVQTDPRVGMWKDEARADRLGTLYIYVV